MNDVGTILLADHDESFLSSTTELLRGDGYAVECAGNGLRAEEALRSGRYDLLVADADMEGNTDLELVLCAQQVARGMPVILVADSPSLDTAIAAVHLPVMAFLIKPLDYGEFRSQIRRLTACSETRRALSRVQDHLNRCLQELDDTMGDAANRNKTELLSISLLHDIASCLSDLLKLRTETVVEGPQLRLCELLDCPASTVYRETLIQAIEVLRQTKSCFKSKQLMNLRLHLGNLLEGRPSLPDRRDFSHFSMRKLA